MQQSKLDLWALWPNGHMCPVEELEENLRKFSNNDFELVEVLEYGQFLPTYWRKYGHYEDFSNDVVYTHQPITPWGGDD